MKEARIIFIASYVNILKHVANVIKKTIIHFLIKEVISIKNIRPN